MKKIISLLAVVICLFQVPIVVVAQTTNNGTENPKPKKTKSLFEKTEILELTIRGDVNKLISDRDESPYRNMQLISKDDDGSIDTIKTRMKTRGNFRRVSGECSYPPLWVNINDSTLKSSVFRKKEKLKLVVPCISDDYVVREWLVYQVQNIITPLSMRARLVKLTLTDAKKDKSSQPMYAMLLEADKDMAKRNNRDIIPDRIMPVQLDKAAYLRTTMFEFLVANTDWSVEFRHNIIIVKNAKDINPLPTAYDFDHSGMVGAPYAHPSEALKMNSVYERRYRGYCITDLTEYDPVIKEFNDKKEQIYALYTNCPYISDKYKSNTTRYLDEFYEIINNSNNFKKYFLYPCDKNGTGNVVISGLNGSNGGE